MSKISTVAVALAVLPLVACGGGGGGKKSEQPSSQSQDQSSQVIIDASSASSFSSEASKASSSLISSDSGAKSSSVVSSSSITVSSIISNSSNGDGQAISSSAKSSEAGVIPPISVASSANFSSLVASVAPSSFSSLSSSQAISSLSSISSSKSSATVSSSGTSSLSSYFSSVSSSNLSSSKSSHITSSLSISSSLGSSLSSSVQLSSSSISSISSSSAALSSLSSSLFSSSTPSSSLSSSVFSSNSSISSKISSSLSSSSSLASSLSSSVTQSSSSQGATVPGSVALNSTNWTAAGTSTLSFANGVQFSANKIGDGIEYTYNGKLPVGSLIEMSVSPNSQFVSGGGNLQIMAVILEDPWNGEYGCWTDNGNLTANSYQTISCTISTAAFNTTSAPIKIVLQAVAGTGQTLSLSNGAVNVNSVVIKPITAASSSSIVSSSSITSSSSSAPSISANLQAIPISEFITVDQFGYLPELEKVAVVRDPQVGFDQNKSFTPSNNYRVFDVNTGNSVSNPSISAWNSGQTAAISGDRVWWVDFSSLTTEGTYTLVDVGNNVRSPNFKIANNVYKEALKHSVRYFYYQRAGLAKVTPYAEPGWTDTASHMGSGQDPQSRLFNVNDKTNGVAGTERDLSGGWYDAGDFNKYTQWHANYLIALLHAYLENPSVWTDDFNIPESNNGIPDLIDEIKWGMDWLIKMQESNGSVLSIQGLSHNKSNGAIASPPSSASGRSFYGPASTTATLGAAAAFALGAKVLPEVSASFNSYANNLTTRAENAWNWAQANPSVIIHNNDDSKDIRWKDLGAGNQEVTNTEREERKLRAAIYLYALTGKSIYNDIVTNKLENSLYHVDMWNEEYVILPWLYYSNLPNVDATTSSIIRTRYRDTMNDVGPDKINFTPILNKEDPYRAHLGSSNFTWGSNRSMSRKGNTFMNLISYNAGTFASDNVNTLKAKNAAVGYLNYLHGSNPLSMVYLSNMGSAGAHNSVDQFYHTWFTHGSLQWDSVNESAYGPPPGFLVGGPNPAYDVDACCANSCSSNSFCKLNLTPPKGQPPMKSYKNMNESWPANSWQITENHNDYQVAYIRLLARLSKN